MKDAGQLYRGYRFSPEIISRAVWLYYRFCPGLRDVEDLLAECGIDALVQKRRSELAAKRFFRELLKRQQEVPRRMVTDLLLRRQLGSVCP